MAKNSALLFWCAFAVLSGVCLSMPLSPCLAPILPNVVHMVACVVLPSTVGCFNTLWNWFGAKVNVGGRNFENMSERKVLPTKLPLQELLQGPPPPPAPGVCRIT